MVKKILDLPISRLLFYVGIVIVNLAMFGFMAWIVYITFTINPIAGTLLGIFLFGFVLMVGGMVTDD